MYCWGCVASIAEGVITTLLLLPRAAISWKKLLVKGETWKALAAMGADREFSTAIPAVRSV